MLTLPTMPTRPTGSPGSTAGYRRRLTPALCAVLALTGCTDPEPTRSFQRHGPTLDPPRGTLADGPPLPDGMRRVDTIPTDELTTDRPDPFTIGEVCADVPAEVPEAAGFTGPGEETTAGYRWSPRRRLLIIGAPAPDTMARQVDKHRSGGDDAHLAWLRVSGPPEHYVIERVPANGESGACTHVVDVGASRAVHVTVTRADPDTGTPVATPPRTGLLDHCPDARAVTLALVKHVDTLANNPTGPVTFPSTTSATGPPLPTR